MASNGDSTEPRNLTQGWCEEGESFVALIGRRDGREFDRIAARFANAKTYEHRAAALIYAVTGLLPHSEDDQSGKPNAERAVKNSARPGAIDIRLEDDCEGVEICEVTTSLDHRFQGSVAAIQKLRDAITADYVGAASWSLELDRGWDQLHLKSLAADIASHLNIESRHNPESNDGDGNHYVVSLHERITARLTGHMTPPVITVHSYNAGQEQNKRPYLDELTEYVATDKTVQGKVDKLAREKTHHNAQRCHLFLGMASTGPRGSLLPVSPSYFTWGVLELPDVLDDLWLEGNTGELYHWTKERGWLFHRT